MHYCTFSSRFPRVRGLPLFFLVSCVISSSDATFFRSAWYWFINKHTVLSPRVGNSSAKCFTAAVFPHWTAYLAIVALASGMKWVYFYFLLLAQRLLSSSKTFSRALLASLVTASGSSASLHVGRDCFLKYLSNVAISLDRLSKVLTCWFNKTVALIFPITVSLFTIFSLWGR